MVSFFEMIVRDRKIVCYIIMWLVLCEFDVFGLSLLFDIEYFYIFV